MRTTSKGRHKDMLLSISEAKDDYVEAPVLLSSKYKKLLNNDYILQNKWSVSLHSSLAGLNLKYKLIFSFTYYSQITVTLNDFVLWPYLGVSWVLRKPLWVRFCAVMWALLCIMSFSDCTRLQYQVTTHIFLN